LRNSSGSLAILTRCAGPHRGPSREVTPSPVTPQQEFRRSDFEKGVVEEQVDRLRLLIVIVACSAFVVASTSVRRSSTLTSTVGLPKSAARPFPQGSRSLGRAAGAK
jgi:hypothetical protein